VPGTILEYADNRNGSPVYADPSGKAIPGDLPTRIPFGTKVYVTCKAPNATGMASVTALYLIAGGKWNGLYVVADTMTNGASPGTADSPNVDPHVSDCT
jgi:hypothetical protein